MLLERLERALAAGAHAWYLVVDGRTRRQRTAGLARRAGVAHPPVGTLRDLALRLLRAAGRSAVPAAEGLLLGPLLEQAVALPQLPRGAGRTAAARVRLALALSDGWSAAQLEGELARLEERFPGDERVEALWRALASLAPSVDPLRPLREVREAGLWRGAAPDLLLVEGGPLSPGIEELLLAELLAAVLARGGEVRAACLDLPPDSGPRARMSQLLRRSLAVAPAHPPCARLAAAP